MEEQERARWSRRSPGSAESGRVCRKATFAPPPSRTRSHSCNVTSRGSLSPKQTIKHTDPVMCAAQRTCPRPSWRTETPGCQLSGPQDSQIPCPPWLTLNTLGSSLNTMWKLGFLGKRIWSIKMTVPGSIHSFICSCITSAFHNYIQMRIMC